MTEQRFTNKRFIVTGAADGIGRATASRLLHEGGRVAMCDVADAKVRAAASELGENAMAITVDVASEPAVQAAFAKAIDWLGGIDGLVNAAGIVDFGQSHDYPLERWQRLLDVVLTGTFIVNKTAIPHLLTSNGAVVTKENESILT